jgi:hypothetical protein
MMATASARALAESPGAGSAPGPREALETRPSQAGSLPDPTLGLNALNLPTDSFALDQEPMTQLQILITQAVEPFEQKFTGRIPIFPVKQPTARGEKLPYVSTGSTGRLGSRRVA